MALRLNQPSDSSGNLQTDLLQIAIDRLGQKEWDTVISKDKISKQKVEHYVKEQTFAIQAFLQRQELNITDMEAYGVIEPGKISIAGGNITGGVVAGPGSPVIGAAILPTTPAKNSNRIKFRVQISDRSNKVGIPEVGRMVKRTLVRFVRIFF